ncbi:MAG: hypothetical protein J0647_03120 [Campylobacteraceae bacterium]|nr:hypothetical protein [Campylobacteraceae bacterium]
MSGEKFINKIQELFGIISQNDESKRKAIKELVKKLKKRRITLKNELREESNLIKRETLKDNIKIIKKQIKKGKDILDD